MMDQLGIKALRPGPSGDESAPNHANYDESKANPYPDLPDPRAYRGQHNVHDAHSADQQAHQRKQQQHHAEGRSRLARHREHLG